MLSVASTGLEPANFRIDARGRQDLSTPKPTHAEQVWGRLFLPLGSASFWSRPHSLWDQGRAEGMVSGLPGCVFSILYLHAGCVSGKPLSIRSRPSLAIATPALHLTSRQFSKMEDYFWGLRKFVETQLLGQASGPHQKSLFCWTKAGLLACRRCPHGPKQAGGCYRETALSAQSSVTLCLCCRPRCWWIWGSLDFQGWELALATEAVPHSQLLGRQPIQTMCRHSWQALR
mmetsp:Transcript_23386/g.51360  ORF Transcript_23386/g.51360 Transcript_23386/m.51360 type:complete len:231 (+) Transcript_23386:1852-2544(+)